MARNGGGPHDRQRPQQHPTTGFDDSNVSANATAASAARGAGAGTQTRQLRRAAGLSVVRMSDGDELVTRLPAPSTFEAARAASLAAGVLAATMVGCVYAFNILSHPMKHHFGLNQSDLDLVATIAFSFAQFNVPAGWLFDHYGAPVVNAIAFTVIALGMALLALIFAGAIPGTVGTLTVAYSLAAWTSGWIDVGTLLPNLYLYPLNRGDVVIIQKTFMGLGSSVFATIFATCFSDATIAWYCALCAVWAAVVGVIAVRFVRSGQDVEKRAGCRFTPAGCPVALPPHASAAAPPVAETHEDAPSEDEGGGDLYRRDSSSAARHSSSAITVPPRAAAATTTATNRRVSQSVSAFFLYGAGGAGVLQAPGTSYPYHHSNTTSAAADDVSGDAMMSDGGAYDADDEARFAARGDAFRLGTEVMPRHVAHCGFVLLAVAFAYLALADAAGIAKWLGGFALGVRILIAAGALGIVLAFGSLVPVAAWSALPTALSGPTPSSSAVGTARTLPAPGRTRMDQAAVADDESPPLVATAAGQASTSLDGFRQTGASRATDHHTNSTAAARPVMHSALHAAEGVGGGGGGGSNRGTPRQTAADPAPTSGRGRPGAPGTPRGGDAAVHCVTPLCSPRDAAAVEAMDRLSRTTEEDEEDHAGTGVEEAFLLSAASPEQQPQKKGDLTWYGCCSNTDNNSARGRVTASFAAQAAPFRFVLAAPAAADKNTTEEEDVGNAAPARRWRVLVGVVVSPPFLMLYVAMIAQLGAGALVTSNGAQIYRAMNGNEFDSTTNAVLSSVGGVGSAAGRVAVGMLDRFAPRVSSTVTVPAASLLSIVAMLLFLFPIDGESPAVSLSIAYFTAQFAYGVTWAGAILAVRLAFPARIVGTVYSMLFTAGIVASLVVNLALFGPHYDAEGKRQGLDRGCAGEACYKPTLIVVAVANGVGVVAGMAFHALWMVHQARRRRDADDDDDDAKEY